MRDHLYVRVGRVARIALIIGLRWMVNRWMPMDVVRFAVRVVVVVVGFRSRWDAEVFDDAAFA